VKMNVIKLDVASCILTVLFLDTVRTVTVNLRGLAFSERLCYGISSMARD